MLTVTFLIDTSNVPETLSAGTVITVGYVSGKYRIYFGTSTDYDAYGYADLMIESGYSLSRIYFGNANNSEVSYCTSSNFGSFSKTKSFKILLDSASPTLLKSNV